MVACSEGGSVEVNGGGVTMTKSLWKRTVATCSEGGVEVVVCSRAGDEAAACFGAGIEDDRWQWWHDSF
jgi:hypothetical protein